MSNSVLSSNNRVLTIPWRIRQCIACAGMFFSLFFALACCPAEAAGDALPQEERVEIVGLKSISRQELLYLLDLSDGSIKDSAALRAGIKRTFLKGIFDDIRVEHLPNQQRLRVIVTERPVIARISFIGMDTIAESALLGSLRQKEGERYRSSLLLKSCASLEKELERLGYRAAKISARVLPVGDRVNLTFALIEQNPDRIISQFIDDPGEVLPSLKKLSVGNVYDQEVLNEIVETTKKTLAKRHYVNSVIETGFSRGNLMIKVQPGKVLTIDFAGNRALSGSALKKETTFFETNAFSDNLVEESIIRMRHQYRQIGYPSVEVVPVIERTDEGLLLTYYIAEGERQRIKAVVFAGATHAEKTLLQQLSFAPGEVFNADLLEANRESLQQYYLLAGHLGVHVDPPGVQVDDDGVIVIFSVSEGPTTRVGQLVLSGNAAANAETLLGLISLTPGEPYSDSALGAAKLKIGEWYQKNGYADVSIDADRKIDGATAHVSLSIREGQRNRFGKNVIVGNESTKTVVLERELLHKEGDPFNPAVFLEERVALSRTGLFSSVDISTELAESGRRDIVYKVQEAPAGALEFGFGYSEYEQFRTFFDVSYRNLWGMNRQVHFRVDASSMLRRATLSYYQPWAFGERDLAFKSSFIVESKKELNIDSHSVIYRSDRYGINAGFEKKFSPEFKAELLYDLSNVRTYDVVPGIVLSREDVGTLLISGVSLNATYDRRDNAVDPTRGYLLGATYKLTGPYFFSETNFSKIVLFANTYRSLSKKIVAAISVRGGVARGFGETKDIPIVERFFLGGRTSVRGYKQDMLGPKDSDDNPIGGEAFLMGNLELRINVWKDFGVVPFLDAGNVWQKASDVTVADLKYTAGLGLRYNTPIGPIRLDYGHKLNREQGEGAGAFHFSIGHAF